MEHAYGVGVLSSLVACQFAIAVFVDIGGGAHPALVALAVAGAFAFGIAGQLLRDAAHRQKMRPLQA